MTPKIDSLDSTVGGTNTWSLVKYMPNQFPVATKSYKRVGIS